MRFEDHNINCNIFWDTGVVIKRADSRMKEARSTKEKQYYAQDILGEVETLLSCSCYNSQSTDCLNCYSISCRYIQKYAQYASLV
ncbi:MAG: hypothetical protein ABIE75_01420 [Candidatus Omnitrophota bacterium]